MRDMQSSRTQFTFLPAAVRKLGEFVPDQEVPVEIQRAFPCLFQYVPPALETPEAAAVTQAAAEPADRESPSPTAQTNEAPAAAAVAVAPVQVVSAQAAVTDDFAAETKKRKRIQPVLVPPTTATSGATAVSDVPAVPAPEASAGGLAAVPPAPVDAPAAGPGSPEPPKSAKKRIAPMLVQPAPTI